MKRALFVGLAILILLAAGGAWLWSLSAVPLAEPEIMTLSLEKPPAEVRRAGAESWAAGEDGMTLNVGDVVRTGAGGRAALRLTAKSEARLQEHSEVVVEAPSRLHLISGRVWSRLTRLFDLDRSFSVRTNSAVATVRGTAFDLGMSASGTALWVSDAAVEIIPAEERAPSLVGRDPFIVTEGAKVTLGPSGAWSQMELLSDADRSSEWFLRNQGADREFLNEIKDAVARRFAQGGALRPSGASNALAKLSEGLRLALTDEDVSRLHGWYFGRRLYGVKILVDENKSGQANQALTRIDQDLQNLLRTEEGKAALPALRAELAEIAVLVQDAGPTSPFYRLKQQLEDLYILLAGQDPAQLLFARLLAVDARLDETVGLIEERRFTDAEMNLQAAENGITNGQRDFDQIASTITNAEQANALHAKLRASRARAAALRARLVLFLAPPPAVLSPTSTPATTTSTSSATPPASSEPPVEERSWDTLVLSAQPNPVTVGSTAQLRLMGSRADGSSADLTSQATFKMIGSLGSLSGATYQATEAGSITIEAMFIDRGTTKTARTMLQVNEAVKLSKLEITPQGSTSVGPGQQVPLIVTAHYSSGLTANVTSKTSWLTSDPNVGSAANGQFTAWVNGQGVVTITGTYTENGMTVTSSVVFTVTPGTQPNG